MPGRAVVNTAVGFEDGFGRQGGRGWWFGGGSGGVGGRGGGSWLSQGDGEGGVEFASHEDHGRGIDEAAGGFDEGPTNDGVDRDIFTQSNADIDGAAIREEVGEMVGDNGAEEAGLDSRSYFRGMGVGDGASEANRVKGGGGVVKLNETVDTGGMGGGQGFVE